MGKRSDFQLAVLIAGLILLHGSLFLAGYRLTADDVEFHKHSMSGISDSWQYIKGTAFAQGRIVHFIDLPFSILGAHYAGNIYFRVFYTAIYFANFILIGKYVSMIAGIRSGLFIVLVLVSLNPLDYFHLPPNAYPFHISLPIMLILISRIALWEIRRADNLNLKIPERLWLLLCLIGMAFSEYGFIFAVALICAEFLARVIMRGLKNGTWVAAIIYWSRHSFTLKDFTIVLYFIVAYFGFRFLFPSSYDGNKMSGNFQFAAFLKTLYGHIYGGTSIASISRNWKYMFGFLKELGHFELSMLISVLLGTFLASVLALGDLIKKFNTKELIYRYWLIAGIGLFCAVIVTIPVATVAKYQSWCGSVKTCIFLDSRISYLGIGVFIAALISGVVANQSTGRRFSVVIVGVISAILAIFGALTLLNNMRIESDMKDFVSGFERANKIACLSDGDLNILGSATSGVIEPVPRIQFHPWSGKDSYWKDYINFTREQVGCEGQEYKITDFVPSLNIGERVSVAQLGVANRYLTSGWSAPEAWGAWSEGDTATILLPLPAARANTILIEAKPLISPTHQKQGVELTINGIPAGKFTLTGNSGGGYEVKVPYAAKEKGGFLKVELHFPDAARPKDIGLGDDSRKLALGLVALTVR
jgi:hypothetical protein